MVAVAGHGDLARRAFDTCRGGSDTSMHSPIP
jgi:hypothetical protein